MQHTCLRLSKGPLLMLLFRGRLFQIIQVKESHGRLHIDSSSSDIIVFAQISSAKHDICPIIPPEIYKQKCNLHRLLQVYLSSLMFYLLSITLETQSLPLIPLCLLRETLFSNSTKLIISDLVIAF